ncbi:ModD protein [Methylobacterium sp. WSM2598]|uniref:ModD protein n=1 Tax=Methylobacterium sp. WSM2598 TaxID=398261 RepID=UPI0003636810|nr:ModD protein [Methylobacterium sp. WSM2598]
MSSLWWSDALIDRWLAEDVPHGDLTTRALGIGERPARMRFSLRAAGTVCGTEAALALVRRAGGEGAVRAASGSRVPAGGVLLDATGPAGALHESWKVAQTLIEALSGIATATAAIVDAARAVAPAIAVVTTRKTLPGAKGPMIAAIRAGGAEPHRLGLSETLLVFPEHCAFLPDPVAALTALRRAAPEKAIVVEVTGLEEARALLAAGPDILQCEKLPPETAAAVKALARAAGGVTRVAAAGGVTAANAAAYAAAGADILVTSAPYWAKPADVKDAIEAA